MKIVETIHAPGGYPGTPVLDNAKTNLVADALPERDTTKTAEQQGLFRKFDVRRVDGSDQLGGKHHGCRYYVLDVDHDPYAAAALGAYAEACKASHPELARDLREKWGAADTIDALRAHLSRRVGPSFADMAIAADAAYGYPDGRGTSPRRAPSPAKAYKPTNEQGPSPLRAA